VKITTQIRVLLALAIVACLLSLLLMPGPTSAVIVQTPGQGKQLIRVVSVLALMMMAVAINRGLFRSTFALFHSFRVVFAHGYGPDLLDKTCARLC
jgi:hypothetical protein